MVNVSSVNGLRSFPGVLAYCVSKAGVDHLTRCAAIEMAALANACGLDVPASGLSFPPCGADELAEVLGARAGAGPGVVEVVSSLARDGSAVPRDLRWGVYVVFTAPNEYAAACFRQYGLRTDGTDQ